MPRIRTLTLISETTTLTTFEDPRTSNPVLVTTDGTTGEPVSLTVNGTDLPLNATTGDLRKWVGTVDGSLWQVSTNGGYPGMTGSCVN